MYAIDHWISKYFTWLVVLCGSAAVAVLLALAWVQASVWWILLTTVVSLLLIRLLIQGAPRRLTVKAVKELENTCDPYPLYEETEKLLTYALPKNYRRVYMINYGTALISIGDLRRAYDILHAINIEAPYVPAVQKYVYYHNLATVCTRLSLMEEAAGCFAYQQRLYASLSKQIQTAFASNVKSACALERYRVGDPLETMRLLASLPRGSRYEGVSNAMLYAKAALAVGETEKARENLDYVIAYGNRLGVVEEAKTLRASL